MVVMEAVVVDDVVVVKATVVVVVDTVVAAEDTVGSPAEHVKLTARQKLSKWIYYLYTIIGANAKDCLHCSGKHCQHIYTENNRPK